MPRLGWRMDFAAAERRINMPALSARPIGLVGEWAALAKEVVTPVAKTAPPENSAPRPANDFAQVDPEGEDTELAGILSGIVEEGRRHCAAACAVIAADFSGRIAHARKALPRDQVAGAISKLNAEWRAATAAAQEEAKKKGARALPYESGEDSVRPTASTTDRRRERILSRHATPGPEVISYRCQSPSRK